MPARDRTESAFSNGVRNAAASLDPREQIKLKN
jgi:hypothetical protein